MHNQGDVKVLDETQNSKAEINSCSMNHRRESSPAQTKDKTGEGSDDERV
jgi:hypothetical protein